MNHQTQVNKTSSRGFAFLPCHIVFKDLLKLMLRKLMLRKYTAFQVQNYLKFYAPYLNILELHFFYTFWGLLMTSD